SMEYRPFLLSRPPNDRAASLLVDGRRNHPDHHGRLAARIFPAERLARETETVARRKLVPCAGYLDVEPAGNQIAGFFGRSLRRLPQGRSRREDRAQHLEAAAQIR